MFQNIDIIDEGHVDQGSLPPLIQWHRGDFKDQNEVLNKGGFILPTERYTSPNHSSITITFNDGSTDDVYAFKGLHLAVVDRRKQWFVGKGQDKRLVTTYTEGQQAWSRTQLWAMVKELGNQEFILTFSSTNSVGIEQAIKDFRQNILRPITAQIKKQLPLYVVWMPVMAGPRKDFKKHNTYSTPPQLGVTKLPLSSEFLEKLYIPNHDVELVKRATELYPEVQKWAKGERQDDREEMTPPNFVDGQVPEPTEALTEFDIPF